MHIYSLAYEGRFAAIVFNVNLTAYMICEKKQNKTNKKPANCVAVFPVIKTEHQMKPNAVLGLEIKAQNVHSCLRVLKGVLFCTRLVS